MSKKTYDYRSGGKTPDIGTTTSDSIDAKLSKDEVVIKADSARKFGVNKLLHINAHGSLPGGKGMKRARGKEMPAGLRGKPKFAAGGLVGGAVDAISARRKMLDDPEAAVGAPAAAPKPVAPKAPVGADIASTAEQDAAAAALLAKHKKKGFFGFACGGKVPAKDVLKHMKKGGKC